MKRTVWGGLSGKDAGKPVTNPAMIKNRSYIYSSKTNKVVAECGAADMQKVFNAIGEALGIFKKATRVDLAERQKALSRQYNVSDQQYRYF